MAIDISNNVSRITYALSAGASQAAFTASFEFFEDTDIKVYVDGVLKSISTHYSVSGGGGATGTVTFNTALTGITGGSRITLLRATVIERTSDFSSGADINRAALNTQLDTLTAIAADNKGRAERALQVPDSEGTISVVLPTAAERKGTVLGFHETTGALAVGPNITAVQSLANVTTSINILGTAAAVEDMGILATAAIVEDMSILGTSGNVANMAKLGTDAIVADMAILATDAIVADMAILATDDIVADMAILGTSDVVTDMNLLATAAVVEDMGLLATSANVAAMGHVGTSANVTAMGLLGTSAVVTDMGILGTAAIVEDMGILATSANVTSMGLLGTSAVVEDMGLLGTAAVVEDMGLLATSAIIEDMGILGTSANVTAMGNVSGAITNVNTVASNVAGVNSFAERYRIASSAPSSSLNVGDLYFDTQANELKVYKSSGWAAAGSTVNGTSARFHYDITGTPTTVSGSDASSNTLAYDAGFIDVYVNGVRMSPADITTTSGSSVVFASALAAGDEVDIVAFGTFAVANIVATGALNSGSITSGFGTINNGASAITTTGVGSFGSLDISGAIDVDGVTNLDVVDIDGAVDMASTALVAGVLTANGGAVFNEASADVDFRVESNGNANMLFVDGGNDTVAIGTSDTDFDPVADNLIVGTGSGSNGITIYTGSSVGNKGSIFFADTAAGNATNSRKGQITYEQNNEIMTFFTADTKAMEIGFIGAVNMPLQPAFLVQPASSQDNIPINANTTVVFGSEVFDQNADFASNTFTAPVTGKYQLNVKINFINVDVTSDYVNVYLATSNRNVVFTFGSGAGDLDTYQTVSFSTLVDMDASDTAYVYINLPNQGAAQMNVGIDSKFSGYLVA